MSDRININGERSLWNNWSKVTNWRPKVRYEPLGTYTRPYVDEIINALEDNPYGFLNWIKKHKQW